MLYMIFENIIYYYLICVIKIKYVIENKLIFIKKMFFFLKIKVNKYEE